MSGDTTTARFHDVHCSCLQIAFQMNGHERKPLNTDFKKEIASQLCYILSKQHLQDKYQVNVYILLTVLVRSICWHGTYWPQTGSMNWIHILCDVLVCLFYYSWYLLMKCGQKCTTSTRRVCFVLNKIKLLPLMPKFYFLPILTI